jgi:hypothetical protein
MNSEKRTGLPWSAEDIQFLRDWYGKIKPHDLAKILNRTHGAIINQTRVHSIKAHLSLYGIITVMYHGQNYELEGRRFVCIRTETGYTNIDTQKSKRRTGRPRKERSFMAKPTEPMAANRRKPEMKEKKSDNKHQTAQVKTFEPPKGKQLVQLDKKTWVYR